MSELLTGAERVIVAKVVTAVLNTCIQQRDKTTTDAFGMLIDECDEFSIIYHPDYAYAHTDGIVVFESESGIRKDIGELYNDPEHECDPEKYKAALFASIDATIGELTQRLETLKNILPSSICVK